MKVLFSPVGSTDPIRNMHDGSMLHIIRHYKPDKIYLFLSHEMHERHKADNRYMACIQYLTEKLEIHPEVNVIVRDDLIRVQDYEVFYSIFKDLLEKISIVENGAELYVNISSGTPAMKSALLVLSQLGEVKFRAIQVSTPLNRSNYTDEDVDRYNSEEQWECNEDNDEESGNRCEEVHSAKLMLLMKLDTIKNHLRAYDYTAASILAHELSNDLGENVVLYVDQALARQRLDYSEVNKIAKITGYMPLPVRKDEDRQPIEYLLAMQVKAERGNYDDFIRSLSPIFMELLDRALQVQCHICYRDYARTTNFGADAWNLDYADPLYQCICNTYPNFRGRELVGTGHLKDILLANSDNIQLNELVVSLRDVEEKVRNKAAHTMTAITEDMIRSWSGMESREILENLKKLAVRVKLVPEQDSKKIWDSYKDMNEKIIEVLNKSYTYQQ